MTEKEPTLSEVYFLRHGESRFNAGIAPDEFDCGLTDAGKQQASQLFGNVDLIIISPLRRAQETLACATKLRYKQIWISELCRERRNVFNCDYFADEAIAGNAAPAANSTLTPETDLQFGRRVLEFRSLLEILRRFFPKILVIAHGIFIMAVTGRTTPIQNCEFFRWESK